MPFRHHRPHHRRRTSLWASSSACTRRSLLRRPRPQSSRRSSGRSRSRSRRRHRSRRFSCDMRIRGWIAELMGSLELGNVWVLFRWLGNEGQKSAVQKPKPYFWPLPDEPDDPEDEAGAGDGDRHEDGHDDRRRHPRLLRVVRLLLCIPNSEH